MRLFNLVAALQFSIFFVAAQSEDLLSKNLTDSSNPMIRYFDNREQLEASPFWEQFIDKRYILTIRSVMICLKDEKVFLIFNEEDQKKKYQQWVPWIGRSTNHLFFTEVCFGDDVYWVGSDNYPILTVSAEYSSLPVQIERELVHGNSIRLNPSLLVLLGILYTGWRVVMESTNSLYVAEKESIICRASPGVRVQLQVSNKMLSFPSARTRTLEYNTKTQEFIPSDWSLISSEVSDQKVKGMLLSTLTMFERARCVTNEAMFESQSQRQLIEYQTVFNQTSLFDHSKGHDSTHIY